MHCTFVGDYWEDVFSKNMSNVQDFHTQKELNPRQKWSKNTKTDRRHAPTTLPGLSLWLVKEDHLDICVR